MKKIDEATKRILTKIARMYYMEDRTQQQIADTMNISRSKISRSLTLAKELGIVKIYIDDEFSEEQNLEKAIVERFGIREACVVPNSSSNEKTQEEMGSAITALLDNVLKDDDFLGIMAGYTLNTVSDNIGTIRRKNVKIIPLVGGMGVSGAPWQVTQAVMTFSKKLDAKYFVLNAPTNVSSKETKDILINEPEIKGVLDMTKKCNIAIVGIGEISDSATLLSIDVFKEEDVKELEEKGTVASMGTAFFDENGNVIDLELSRKMIGIDTDVLRNIPTVIAIAYGEKKVNAVRAALKSGIIDIIVTDSDTANKVLH